MMRRRLIAALLAATCACAPLQAAEVLRGTATAVDGDSLHLAGRSVRLAGIDAFEWQQTCPAARGRWNCGAAAKAFLASLVDGRMLACAPTGRSRNRVTATCWRDGQDVAEALVAAGLALADPRYAPDYCPAQAAARKAGAGAWRDATPPRPCEARQSGCAAALADQLRRC